MRDPERLKEERESNFFALLGFKHGIPRVILQELGQVNFSPAGYCVSVEIRKAHRLRLSQRLFRPLSRA